MSTDHGTSGSPKVIVVIGPTASGKSALAVEIAKSLRSVVVSVDSLQVYRDFSVVSDKISGAEMQGVPHFGIDLVDPGDELDVARYLKYALELINSELQAGRSPVIVGGTNMYVEKLLFTSRLDDERSPSSEAFYVPSAQRDY